MCNHDESDVNNWLSVLFNLPVSKIGKLTLVQTREWSTVFRVLIEGRYYAVKIGGLVQKNEVLAYQILNQISSASVPRLIGIISDDNHQWICLEWVEGEIFGDNPQLNCVTSVAKELAVIQLGVISLVNSLQFEKLPNRTTSSLGEFFKDALGYLGRFEKKARRDYARYMPKRSVDIPLDICKRLENFQPKLISILNELRSWNNSLEHGDLHARNFGLRESGQPFLLDWSNASKSLPFISLEFLLRVTRNTLGSDIAHVVTRTYLETLEIGQYKEREYALTLSRGLASLNFVGSLLFRESAEKLESGSLAWLVARSLNQLYLYYEGGSEWRV